MKRAYALLFAFIFIFSHLWHPTLMSHPITDRGIDFELGPEIYYVERKKEGGAKQTGMQYGIRACYERIKRYKFYYALDGLYSCGLLTGKSSENKIHSHFSNTTVETRFGYTLAAKCFPCFSFTPFIGAGCCWEINNYVHPSPLHVHFKNKFHYVPVGFLSEIDLTNNWTAGVNFKARFIWDGKQHITHDPQFDDSTLTYEEHIQYRVELPIKYYFAWCSKSLAVNFSPFYEYRHYGKRACFPHDFIDTKFNFFGATLLLLYRF